MLNNLNLNKYDDDSFLCSDCRNLGYCKKRIESNSSKVEFLVTDNEISHWVPVNARKLNGSNHFYTNLQKAHDLFHQGEFETASYLYRGLLSTRSECSEVYIGLAASLYFLFQFEEAAAIADKLTLSTYDFAYKFATTCEKRYAILNETNGSKGISESGKMALPEIMAEHKRESRSFLLKIK